MDGFHPYTIALGIQKLIYTPSITTSRIFDGVCVDGISITSGSPRKHIWTYAVGLSDDYVYYSYYNCPCANISWT